MGDRNLRELWLRADRGAIEALGDMEELLEYGDFENEAAVEAYWNDMYPDDEYWYFFCRLSKTRILATVRYSSPTSLLLR